MKYIPKQQKINELSEECETSLDDFWNDIEKEESFIITKEPNTNPNNNININLNNNSNNTSTKHTKSNSFISTAISKHHSINNNPLYTKYNFLLEKFATPNKQPHHTHNNNNIKTANVNRYEQLYKQAKYKYYNLKQKQKENLSKTELSELSQCTFKPYTNEYPFIKHRNKSSHHEQPHVNDIISLSIYERGQKWLIDKQENISNIKRRNSYDKSNQIFTYTPTLYQVTPEYINSIFNAENSIINQPENQNYLQRQYQARFQSAEKAKKHDTYLHSTNIIENSHYTTNKSISISNALLKEFKNKIHSEILNI
jgi:hypothetical protein